MAAPGSTNAAKDLSTPFVRLRSSNDAWDGVSYPPVKDPLDAGLGAGLRCVLLSHPAIDPSARQRAASVANAPLAGPVDVAL